MTNPIKTIYNISKKVLSSKGYLKKFLIVTSLFLAIFILLPTYLTPGNTLKFQLIEVFTYWNYIMMILISASLGLMISMQIYSHKLKNSMKNTGKGVVGGFSGFVAGIFGTAACSSCVAAIFGFLGLGTVFFLIEYQPYIVIGSLLLVLISIYLTAKGIERGCDC